MRNQMAGKIFVNDAPQDLLNTLAAARRGDSEAFSSLTEPHRLELRIHCYRMLGSLEDAEDQVQETFLRAWRRLETYEGRASFRAWLYKIATNACLDALAHRPKRILPQESATPSDPSDLLPLPVNEPTWIEPFPEEWFAPASSNPEARYDAYESISLAFLVALQVLPPRQRTVLILSDVLAWSMAEIADTLGTTVSSVTSLIHRARATMQRRNITGRQDTIRMGKPDDQTRKLLDRYVHAWETADIEGIVSLLTEDATFPMPPMPFWIRGKPAIRTLIGGTILSGETQDRWKLVSIRANGQSGFAFYRIDEATRTYHPFALQILTIENGLISDATTFGFPALFRHFNLPPILTI
jgi:RNA polymerase sigma-70 factor (ECF subfamily)